MSSRVVQLGDVAKAVLKQPLMHGEEIIGTSDRPIALVSLVRAEKRNQWGDLGLRVASMGNRS